MKAGELRRLSLWKALLLCMPCRIEQKTVNCTAIEEQVKAKKKTDKSVSQQVKNPDEDCDMVTALDTDNLTKIQFQFLEAARTNRRDILEMIIEQRACRLDVKNNLDRTALHLAAAQQCFEAVQVLVNAKAPVDIPDKHGMTPMFWAAYKDYVEIVVFLIKNGASVHRKTKRGFTLLHILAKSDSIKTLELLVRSKIIRNFQEVDLNGYTPLMIATVSASLKAATVLSRIGSLDTHLDNTGKNVFHLAVLGCCPLVLEQLCKHEMTPSLINAFDDDLMAPIHYAVDLENSDCLATLLKFGARVNIKSKNAPYPLIGASQRSSVDAIRLLLNNKARLSLTNFAGNTALHISCMANKVETVRYLLRKGADILALNKRLQTPFNAAVEQGSTEAAELLILAGAPINEVDRTAKTPLMLAALSGFVRIVDMIIKADRWRLANPDAVIAMSKKYRPRKEEWIKHEAPKEPAVPNEDEDIEATDSISQAATFVSESVAKPSDGECDNDDDDSDSISCAETYRSASENENGHDNQLSVPVPSYRKTDSTPSNASVVGGRIQKAKQSKVSSAHDDIADFSSSTVQPPTRSSYRSSKLPTGITEAGYSVSPPHSPVQLTTYSSVSQPEFSFLTTNQSYAGRFQTFFFYVSHKRLHRGEWKSLAKHWNFTEEQIEAIELRHTGDRKAYKEHGFRMLCIWMHGLSEECNPGLSLYKALLAIGRRLEAENMQRDYYRATHGRAPSRNECHIS